MNFIFSTVVLLSIFSLSTSLEFAHTESEVWVRNTQLPIDIGSNIHLFDGTAGMVETFMIHTIWSGEIQTKIEYKSRVRSVIEYVEVGGGPGYQPGVDQIVQEFYATGGWNAMTPPTPAVGGVFFGSMAQNGVFSVVGFVSDPFPELETDSNGLLLNPITCHMDIDFRGHWMMEGTNLAIKHHYLMLKKLEETGFPETHEIIAGSDEFLQMFPMESSISDLEGNPFSAVITTTNASTPEEPAFIGYLSILSTDHSKIWRVPLLEAMVPTVSQGIAPNNSSQPVSSIPESSQSEEVVSESSSVFNAETSAEATSSPETPTDLPETSETPSDGQTAWKYDIFAFESGVTSSRVKTSVREQGGENAQFEATAETFPDRLEFFTGFRAPLNGPTVWAEMKIQFRKIIEFNDVNNDNIPQSTEIVSEQPASVWPWNPWVQPSTPTGDPISSISVANNAELINFSVGSDLMSFSGWSSVNFGVVDGEFIFPSGLFGKIVVNNSKSSPGNKIGLLVNLSCSNKIAGGLNSVQNSVCNFGDLQGGIYWDSSLTTEAVFLSGTTSANFYIVFLSDLATEELSIEVYFM